MPLTQLAGDLQVALSFSMEAAFIPATCQVSVELSVHLLIVLSEEGHTSPFFLTAFLVKQVFQSAVGKTGPRESRPLPAVTQGQDHGALDRRGGLSCGRVPSQHLTPEIF